jgi:uncharacterized protein (TIGR02246 family)
MKRTWQRWAVAAVLLMVGAAVEGQANRDAEFKKLADDYAAAWARGDGKAIADLHTVDAIRISADGELTIGRAAIEKAVTEALAGPMKGTKLVITQGVSKAVTADVYVGEGTYEITGLASTPAPRGRYLNTLVLQGGRWLLASNAAIAPPAK